MPEISAAARRARLRAKRRQKIIGNATNRMTRVGGSAEDVPTDGPVPAPQDSGVPRSPQPAPTSRTPQTQEVPASPFAPGMSEETFMQTMQAQNPELLQQMRQLNAGAANQIPTAATASAVPAMPPLPPTAGAWTATALGVAAGAINFFSSSLLFDGVFATMMYIILSIEIFGVVSTSWRQLWSRGASISTAFTLARSVAKASKNVGVLVFSFVSTFVLCTKMNTATEHVETFVPVLRGYHPASLTAAVLALIACTVVVLLQIAERTRLNKVAGRFSELTVLMLRHQRQMAQWAEGYRTTFGSEEAKPYLTRSELRKRVVAQLARAEPDLIAAQFYDSYVEPSVLSKSTVHQRAVKSTDGDSADASADDIVEWIPAAAAQDVSKSSRKTAEQKRQARLQKAAQRAAQ